MREHAVGPVTIELARGNIAAQGDLEAVVNAANAQLQIGGGVAGAIHAAAGPGLAAECRPLAPIEPGVCVITGAHGLPNERVVHCLGPVYGRDEPADGLLADCYRHGLELAEEAGVSSVGFPAISTGAFGYPMRPAAEVAVSTVLACVDALASVRLVRFVLYSPSALEIHEQVLAGLAD